MPKDPLKINLNSHDHPYPAGESEQKRMNPRRLTSYFIVLIESGSINYNIDLQDVEVAEGDVFFAMPGQIFVPPAKTEHLKYVKVLFDESTLVLLPKQYSFLVNPLHTQVIHLEQVTRERVKKVFEILYQILHTEVPAADTEVILAYFHLLLSELNSAYFKAKPAHAADTPVSKFVEFKLLVEMHLTEQPSIQSIADKLSLTTHSLYRLVKEHSGASPKDFFTQRLMMEAQRKLRYSNISVKELAYELGFSDPDYFSRLFKKSTGTSVSEFLESREDL